MATRYPLVLNGSSIQELQPGDILEANAGSAEFATNATNAQFAVNATNAQFAVNATNADNATNAEFLKVSGQPRQATIDFPDNGTPNSIACRDANGNLNAVTFQGQATSALFADLAEKYLPDQPYDVGTVVAVGGSAEITACKRGDRAFGAVSANPAFKMNDGLEGGIYIALKGRVPIKIIGPIVKGDKVIAAENGCAAEAVSILRSMPIRASTFPDTFAIALETNSDPGVKLVECIIL